MLRLSLAYEPGTPGSDRNMKIPAKKLVFRIKNMIFPEKQPPKKPEYPGALQVPPSSSGGNGSVIHVHTAVG